MKVAKPHKPSDKMRVTESNGATTVVLKGSDNRRWVLPVATLLSVILLIVGAMVGETIRPKPYVHWSEVRSGFNIYATVGGLLGFIAPYVYFLNRKQKLVFSDKGIALRNRLYLWKDFEGFHVVDDYDLRESGHSIRTTSSIGFQYGIKDIEVGIGWRDKLRAEQIIEMLYEIELKYNSAST